MGSGRGLELDRLKVGVVGVGVYFEVDFLVKSVK